MKRKPIDIMAGLINALNSYSNENQKYSINKIHDDTTYHWNTVKDYIKLIVLIKQFAPDLGITNDNEIRIIKHSPYFKTLEETEQLVLYLFISNAFDDQSAIDKKRIVFRNGFNMQYSQEFISQTAENGLYLTLKGKFLAQGILASIYKDMVDFIQDKLDVSLKKRSENWPEIFYGDGRENYYSGRKLKTKLVRQDREEVKDLSSIKALDDYTNFSKKPYNLSTESIA